MTFLPCGKQDELINWSCSVNFIYHFQISIIQGVLSDINLKKGESECQYYIDKLEYLDEKQRDPRIEASKVLLCHGELRSKSGHVGDFTAAAERPSLCPFNFHTFIMKQAGKGKVMTW